MCLSGLETAGRWVEPGDNRWRLNKKYCRRGIADCLALKFNRAKAVEIAYQTHQALMPVVYQMVGVAVTKQNWPLTKSQRLVSKPFLCARHVKSGKYFVEPVFTKYAKYSHQCQPCAFQARTKCDFEMNNTLAIVNYFNWR